MSRLLCVIAGIGICVSAFSAEEYADEELAASPRHQEWVNIDAGNGDVVSAFVVYPERPDASDSVVVIHDIMAMTPWIRLIGDRLAADGFLAVVPDLLSGKGPDGGDSDTFESVAARGKAMRELDPAEVDRRLKACVEYARGLESTTDAVSVGGFCWGGATTFRYATTDPTIKGAHVFYGNAPDAEALAKIEAPVYGYYAENDARVNVSIEPAAEVLGGLGKTFEPVTYPGVGHGFLRTGTDPEGNEVYRNETQKAWDRWVELLNQ